MNANVPPVNRIEKGESCEIMFSGDLYTVTRCMDEGFTVWREGRAEPYRIRSRGRGKGFQCDCPGFYYRKRCRHQEIMRGHGYVPV
jgi:hypothetical protein